MKLYNIYSTGSAANIFLSLWVLTFAYGLTAIGPIPVKPLFMVFFLLLSTVLFINKSKLIINSFFALLALWLYIIISIAIGLMNGFGLSTLSQATSVVASFLIVIYVFTLKENNFLNIEQLKSVIYITAFMGVLIQLLISYGIVFGLFTGGEVNKFMRNILGSPFFEVNVYGGFLGLIPRISSAGYVFFLVAFLFYSVKASGIKTIIATFFIILFIITTNSRYLMFILLIILVYLAFLKLEMKPLTLFKISIFIGAVLIVGLSLNFQLAILIEGIHERFTGAGSVESDLVRVMQAYYITESVSANFIFGIGMGGFVEAYIRNPINPWHYELEYLSMLMQFGVIGYIFIVFNYIIYVILSIFRNNDPKFKAAIIISLIALLVTPLQSSLLVGTGSAIIIISIFILSRKSGVRNEGPMHAKKLCKLEKLALQA